MLKHLHSLIVCLLSAGVFAGQSPTVDCSVLFSPSPHEFELFTPTAANNYQQSASFSGDSYLLSPDHHHLAVERRGNSQLGTEVVIYAVLQGSVFEPAVLPDLRLIGGSAWSGDSRKLLLQDAQSSGLLYLYDLDAHELRLLSSTFEPLLEVFQVAWSKDDQLVAFAAQESPFPTTEYADVTALYILDPAAMNYYPLTSSDEVVGWYFENFVWTTNGSLAFTTCSLNGETCDLNVRTPDGILIGGVTGDFWLLDGYTDGTLLVLDSAQLDQNGSGLASLEIFDPRSLSFEPIIRLPVDSVSPFPLFSFSPNRNRLSYADETGSTLVLDLQTGVTHRIEAATDFDPGVWHPDGQQLLFQSGSNIYAYRIEDHETQIIASSLDDLRLSQRSWVCADSSSIAP